MTQREHEQGKAHSVADEADQPAQEDFERAGERSSRPQPQQQIDGSRDQSFPLHDLQRIGERNLAGEIVVDAPRDAGADDGERAGEAFDRRRSRPRHRGRAGDETGHAERDAPIEVLVKDEPRQQRRGRALDRQQQGRGGGRRAREPEHQQHRAGDAAQGNRAGEPSVILARERLLPRGGCIQDWRRQSTQQRDADARAAVEEAGQNHGVHDPEQRLGRGRGDAEQGGRCERSKDSGGIHAFVVSIPDTPRGVILRKALL